MRPDSSPSPTRRPSSCPLGSALLLLAALALVASGSLVAQGSAHDYQPDESNQTIDPEILEGLEFRFSGFSRGGRSTAVAGVPGQPMVYYFGGTGGGVWKTTNAGNTWENISDGSFGVGSVGAIAVAPSDPNVVYVGTGSACPRGNISNGDGMYRSLDAGATWTHIGLEAAGQIGRIAVHPKDADLLYAAVLGNLFGPNEERGVYRSKDGGATWENVNFISAHTGFVDLAMDATNPRIIYAAAWRADRKPWGLTSGSEEGGLWKTTDGGDTWEQLTGGLPEGLVGRIGVTVSPARPERAWALIEAPGDKGGVYRTDDGGKTWKQINTDAKLKQRPWYYSHIYADPHNADMVYALNTGFYRSIDGGRSFPEQIRVPHGDNHDLWINPNDPTNMINANDGGANVSFDSGGSWSWQMNQPTAEMYRVFVDDHWPYRIYGPQQDNSTIRIPSQGRVAWNRQPPDWKSVGGCESGHIGIDPRDNDVVYAGCYGGSISRVDLETGDYRQIITYPQLQLGAAPRDLKYRFQWNAPISISPHDPDVIYHTSQVVHRSNDKGQSWSVISPDLTTDNEEQQDYTGGPISHDSTGVEVYNTIFEFVESPARAGEMWSGSDDGLIHVSRDGGETWDDVTPAGMPEGGTVNMIDISPHDPDRLHTAVYRYRENDFRPYIFQSNDSGTSWTLLTTGRNGIPETNFTRSVVEDPVRRGLLYAGTEYGLYVSFDDGAHWQRFQGENLPVTPITDMVIHRNDLVMSTQGRSFWIFDDLSPIQQLTAEVANKDMHLFAPRTAYRGGNGAEIRFWSKAEPAEAVRIEILDGADVVYETEWKPGKDGAGDDGPGGGGFFGFGPAKLEVALGLNSFNWNLRGEAPKAPEGVVHWGFTPGIAAVPGTYTVRMTSGEWSEEQPLEIKGWPTVSTSQAEYDAQREMSLQIADRLESIYDAINKIRSIKGQVKAASERLEKAGIEDEDLTEQAKALDEALSAVLGKLTQVKSKSGQDPLNFPPMIDNQYVELYAYVVASEYQPPAGAQQRLDDLQPEFDALMAEYGESLEGVEAFNQAVAAKNVPAIVVDEAEKGDDD